MTNTLNNVPDETNSEIISALSAAELAAKPEQLTLEEWHSYIQSTNDWDDSELETAAMLAIRSKNRRKYSASGIDRAEVDRSYLHHDSYEVRKAKAEQLNGCKFKSARAYKPFK